jgi:hypothetical protein
MAQVSPKEEGDFLECVLEFLDGMEQLPLIFFVYADAGCVGVLCDAIFGGAQKARTHPHTTHAKVQ